jgi:glycosyltransferase involved in cell wall biosynthesis
MGSRVLYGQERANIHVLETLQAKGCQVLAVVEGNPRFPAMEAELASRQINLVAAPFLGRRAKGHLHHFLFKNPILFACGNLKALRAIRQFHPSHFHIPNPIFFLAFIPVFQFIHISIIYRAGDKPASHNIFWRWLWGQIVHRTDHFVAVSKFIAHELEALGVPRERITVIYNAPPLRKQNPEPNRMPDNIQHLLFIGQLTQEKGIDRLVDAFRSIAPDYPLARLTVIGRISDWSGDDWARALRDRTISDPLISDRVAFIGETEDIYAHLASSGALVVPSICEEALSNVVGEAKAAARPSIVFPKGGLPELIEHGVDGYVCRDTSVAALVEGLRYYLDHPARVHAHGRAALASMARLGIDRFAEAWMAVYTGQSDRGNFP